MGKTNMWMLSHVIQRLFMCYNKLKPRGCKNKLCVEQKRDKVCFSVSHAPFAL